MNWTDDYRTGQTVEVRVHASDLGGAAGDFAWIEGMVEATNGRLGFIVVATERLGPILVASPEKVRTPGAHTAV